MKNYWSGDGDATSGGQTSVAATIKDMNAESVHRINSIIGNIAFLWIGDAMGTQTAAVKHISRTSSIVEPPAPDQRPT